MRFLISILLIGFPYIIFSQTILSPNFGSNSHPTLTIDKIGLFSTQVTMYLTITNKSDQTDWFCIDDKTFISDQVHSYKILNAEGIPNCPESTPFKILESKKFVLTFPPLKSNSYYINLIEPCNEFCISVYGIITNTELNEMINRAYIHYQKGNLAEAEKLFKEMIKEYPDYPCGIWVFNLLSILKERGNQQEANQWISYLKNSDIITDKDYYLDLLK